jgi:hypothetical protein
LEDDSIGHPVDFCLWGWMKRKFYKKKEVEIPDELLAPIIDVAACIKKREDQFRRTKPDLRTGFAKFIVVDGGIHGHLY